MKLKLVCLRILCPLQTDEGSHIWISPHVVHWMYFVGTSLLGLFFISSLLIDTFQNTFLNTSESNLRSLSCEYGG